MKVKIIAFGIARDILGDKSVQIEFDGSSSADLKARLLTIYPKFTELRHFNIAVNEEYANEQTVIHEDDEVVIIPPVSGG